MKVVHFFIPIMASYLLTSLLYGSFSYFSTNMGGLWINVNFMYILILGFVLSLLILKDHIIIKLLHTVLAFFLIFGLVLMAIDQNNDLSNQSLGVFLLFILILNKKTNQFFLEFIRKTKNKIIFTNP